MRLGIIGAGRVGTSFVLAMPSAVEGILCSTKEHTTQRAQSLKVKAYTDGAALLRNCDVLLLTVRDDVIGSVAASLADSLTGADRRETCILHCSGAMDLSSLEPLSALGYSVGSLHPLQSFAAPSGDLLRHIYMAVDGMIGPRKRLCFSSRPWTVNLFLCRRKNASSITQPPVFVPITS